MRGVQRERPAEGSDDGTEVAAASDVGTEIVLEDEEGDGDGGRADGPAGDRVAGAMHERGTAARHTLLD